MPPQTENRVVVITGASSGIGRATALAFAPRGARVVPAALSVDMASMPLRMADPSLTTGFRLLEAMQPMKPPGPDSR